MAVKPGYKLTEVGVIPEDWETTPLGDIFVFKNGLNKSKEYFGHGSPIVNYMDIYTKSGLNTSDLIGRVLLTKQEIDLFRVAKGDVFFTRTSETVDEIGLTAVLLEDSQDTVFSGFVLRARPINNSLTDNFKKYCFSSSTVRKQIVKKSTYTTRALTNGKHLSSVILPLPPLPEQTAITTALSDVDSLISSLDALISKKKQIKQGAMQELLSGKRRLPGFSGEWEVKRLWDVALIKTGARNNQDKVEDGVYPFFVRSENIERINSYCYDEEAILVPGEGRIGDIFHYIHGRFDVHQRVYVINQFSKDVFAKFIYFYLVKYFGKHAMQNTVKATVDSLRLPTFQKFEITIPPQLTEQQAIAAILSDMDAEITTLESRRNKTKLLKQGMMQELLTGRIRLPIAKHHMVSDRTNPTVETRQ